MKKIFSLNSLKLNIYNVSTSIIFNDEKIKHKLINEMPLDDYFYIDSKVIKYNISVREYLQVNEFNMKKIPYFGLESFMSKRLRDLNQEMLIYLKIITCLSISTGIVIFDDVLSFLSDEKKNLIMNYIYEKDINFINFTSDIEESLYAKYLIVLGHDGVAIEGETKKVLKEEKLLKRLGFNLPFVFDLSLQLMSYGILDKEYYDIEKLVIDLWN